MAINYYSWLQDLVVLEALYLLWCVTFEICRGAGTLPIKLTVKQL